MKVFAYIRVSTKEQAKSDKFGIPNQRGIIEKYAVREDLTVSEWYVDDGYSGSTQMRPKLQKLLTDLNKLDEDSAVIVPYFDRLSRDSFLYHFLIKEFMSSGATVVSATEESLNSDDPHADLMKSITVAFAQFERQRITARMAGGRRQKAEAGGHATGRIPFGFEKSEAGDIRKVPAEVREVQDIFSMRDRTGWSLRKIAGFLNNSEATKKWSASSVRYVLKNELYKGRMIQTVDGEEIVKRNELFKIV